MEGSSKKKDKGEGEGEEGLGGEGGFKPTRDALPTINHFKKLIYLQNLG